MPWIEEARGPALGRLLPLEPRLGGRHQVAAFLERLGDRRELRRRARAVERVGRARVLLERREVVALRRLVRLDLLLQALDVLGERDEIFARRLTHLAGIDPSRRVAA